METDADKDLIRQENKKMIHEMLEKIMKEQTKLNGQWTDDAVFNLRRQYPPIYRICRGIELSRELENG